MLETVEFETGAEAQWSIIWLHGLGADAHDFTPILPELVRKDWPSLRFIFPNAPMRAITLNNGAQMRAWYDIVSLDLADRADVQGVEESVAQVEELIAREHERGTPLGRILLAGFSQGGAIILAAGLARREPLAGLIALSTYLPGGQRTAADADEAAIGQPIFMAHGESDPVIPLQYAEHSMEILREAGFNLEWHRYPIQHQVCAEEIDDLAHWMSRLFATS